MTDRKVSAAMNVFVKYTTYKSRKFVEQVKYIKNKGNSSTPHIKHQLFRPNLKEMVDYLETNVGVFALCGYKLHEFGFLKKENQLTMERKYTTTNNPCERKQGAMNMDSPLSPDWKKQNIAVTPPLPP